MSTPYQGGDGRQWQPGPDAGQGGYPDADAGAPDYSAPQGHSATDYEQAPSSYDQSSAYGQSSYGDSSFGSPSYGQSSPAYAPSSPFGDSSSSGGYGAYASSGYGPSYGAPAPKRRGLKRMILGILAMVTSAVLVLVGAFLGAVIGAAVSMASIDAADVTVIAPGQQVELTDGIYFLGSTQSGATCTVTGTPAGSIENDSDSSGAFTFDKDGTTYSVVSQLTVTGTATAGIDCGPGAELAIAPIGFGGMITGFLIGIGLPILLGLVGLILTIWGIVLMIRTRRTA